MGAAAQPSIRVARTHHSSVAKHGSGIIEPNLTSVALWIETPTHVVLLGADLERHAEYGWSRAIVETADIRPSRSATLLKVPHHGSENADDSAMWTDLLAAGPQAVVTPWRATLPRDSDLERLSRRVSELKLAASPRWGRWNEVASAITSAIPGAHVLPGTEIGYVAYQATDAGWRGVEGTL